MTQPSYNGLTLRHTPYVFVSAEAAERYADACVKPMRVVLGLVGDYVIVCPADAERMIRAGYEMAPTTKPSSWS